MATTKQPARLTKALLETAQDMHRVGVIDAATHAQITLRHLRHTAGRDKSAPPVEPISGEVSATCASRRA